ncbi:NosD domain-containing protein [Nonomuraea cavernae]|uniref:NosD domain-containing protein n=1 Tax=Nonomuraea cavernae TaxID=2045107 RepID=UPI0033FDCB75
MMPSLRPRSTGRAHRAMMIGPRRRATAAWWALIIASGVVGAVSPAAPASAAVSTYVVLNANDAGARSLADAITQANANPGKDDIVFRIPGAGPHTIVLGRGGLPAITDPVTIDGYSQPGSIRPSAVTPATLQVEIDTSNTIQAGLDVRTDGSLITGLVVNGAPLAGVTRADIRITGDQNQVTASYIGTDVAGVTPISTGYGIQIDGDDNVIGGSQTSGNLISSGYGARVTAGSRNVITGNRIGTDAAGSGGLAAFGGRCVSIEESDANTVSDNLLADCAVGVYVSGDDNLLQGNLIGTDLTGTRAIGNGEGVWVHGGDRNRIGGTGPGDGNVISGNDWFGIELSQNDVDPADANLIQGNKIGVDSSGATAMPNGQAIGFGQGILVSVGNDNVIGGTEPGAANVISANAGNGVHLQSTSSGTHVLGNRIGTDLAGTANLGNTESGIEIDGSGNHIGDGTVSGHNVVAHNGQDGVQISNGTNNTILVNSIFRNDGLGIDLAPDGRNVDSPVLDPLDADAGANDLQNAPSLSSALRAPASTTVTWNLDSLPQTRMRVEFYSSGSCDPTGFGEGLLYLPGGLITVTTDGAGHSEGAVEVAALPLSSVITATATPLTADGTPTSTSEFSECIVVR